jgi:hypothetical protein
MWHTTSTSAFRCARPRFAIMKSDNRADACLRRFRIQLRSTSPRRLARHLPSREQVRAVLGRECRANDLDHRADHHRLVLGVASTRDGCGGRPTSAEDAEEAMWERDLRLVDPVTFGRRER